MFRPFTLKTVEEDVSRRHSSHTAVYVYTSDRAFPGGVTDDTDDDILPSRLTPSPLSTRTGRETLSLWTRTDPVSHLRESSPPVWSGPLPPFPRGSSGYRTRFPLATWVYVPPRSYFLPVSDSDAVYRESSGATEVGR